MKGIILAGGHGSRLYPITQAVSKQLLPIYDKPMIYYPLSVLMLAGIRDIALISNAEHLARYETLFGDGSHLGMRFHYIAQAEPAGVAQAFVLAESFIGEDSIALILGDNLFYHPRLQQMLQGVRIPPRGATLFTTEVEDPCRYGVAIVDERNRIVALDEKPEQPKSNLAVTGLYLYDEGVVKWAKKVKPSARGELEITDLNKLYLENGKLSHVQLEQDVIWLDTGTSESLADASRIVQQVEQSSARKIACIDELAYRLGFISYEQLQRCPAMKASNAYGAYVRAVKEVL